MTVSRAGRKRTQARLRRLRRRAQQTERCRPGSIRLDRLSVAYTDLMSFYTEYKDIFVRRIYHFEAATPRPRILDGGGCIGMSVLYFKRVYPGARVITFEPDARALTALRRNLAANHLTDIEVVPMALSDRPGAAHFQPDGSDGGRIVPAQGCAESVGTVCLSDYLAEPADFVKLNIEGQELPVLREVEARGRMPQIRELVLEYHGWADGPQSLGAVLELLERNAFRYLVHDFDQETNPASKPPFHLAKPKSWFCLVYGRRVQSI